MRLHRIDLLVAAGLALAATLGCDQSLSITPVNESYSQSRADLAFQRSSEALRTSSLGVDVACPVRLLRTGGTTAVAGNNTINTDSELRTIFRVPGYMKVVNKLNRCGGRTSANLIGCAQLGNPTMIVEDLADNGVAGDDDATETYQGVLIAHEFGHTQGLRHRQEATPCAVVCEAGVCFDECALVPAVPTLMSPNIGPTNNVINTAECNALLKPLPAPASAPCTICEGGICFDQCNIGFGGVSEPPPAGSARAPVRDFVRRMYPDTMPFAEAMRYGPEDMPTLLEMLADPRERMHWSMIASVIGIVADERSAGVLIDFVAKERRGRIRPAEYRAIASAIVALGYTVERSRDPRALAFLIQASEPGFWSRQPRMAWTSRAAPNGERNNRLRELAVMGLGLSGHRDAWLTLQRHWSTLRLRQGQGSDAEQRAMQELVEQAMGDHERVTKDGLAAYYR